MLFSGCRLSQSVLCTITSLPQRASQNSFLPRRNVGLGSQIDWVSMTRKWGLDIVDGMHHGQPPTRMLAYLLMHHVCHATESKR